MTQIIGHHAAERCNTRSCGDEQRFLGGIAHDEETQRRAHLHRIAEVHGEKPGRENAFLDEIETQLELVSSRKRSDGIGPRDLLSLERFRERHELSGLEMKFFDLRYSEDEIAHIRRECVGIAQDCRHRAWLARSSRASKSAGWPASS